MVFICFGNEERNTIVKRIIDTFKDVGFDFWYDYSNLILGDNLNEAIFIEGIDKSEYAIIVYSKSFFKHPSAVKEENYIFEKLKEKKIHVFPILFKVNINELESENKEYIKQILYNELATIDEAHQSLIQIILYILKKKTSIDTTRRLSLEDFSNDLLDDAFIYKEIKKYVRIAANDVKRKEEHLSIIFDYLNITYKSNGRYEKLFYYVKHQLINSKYQDFKEIEIMEIIILLLIRSK